MILLLTLLAQEVLSEGAVGRPGSPAGFHGASIRCLDLAPDGKRLVSGG